MLRKRDLLWLLAYPLYQIIGTIRHEASHALTAWLEGAAIQQFVFLPGFHDNGYFYWGYVSWQGETTWLTTAAPYLCDLLTCGLAFAILMWWITPHRWLWLNAMVIGMASPLFNSLYNYAGGFFRSGSDAAKLLRDLPDSAVHVYFVFTLAGYFVGIWAALRFSRMARR